MRILLILSLLALTGPTSPANSIPKSHHDVLEEWARDTVLSYFSNDPSGTYNICYSHSIKDKSIDARRDGFPEGDPIGLPLELPEDVLDACAVILIGGEW